MLTLAAGAYELERDQVLNMVLPGTPGRAGSASVVFLGNQFPDIMQDLADGVRRGLVAGRATRTGARARRARRSTPAT